MVVQYFLFCGMAFLLFYVFFKRSMIQRKIQQRLAINKDFLREIKLSLSTIVIFFIVNLLLAYTPAPYNSETYQHSWMFYLAAYPLMLFIHDTYFYWSHRLMHHRWLFRWFHLSHHRSHNPSPWASFAFNPLEAFMQAGILAVFHFILPISLLHISIFFIFSLLYNIYGHLGYELYPKRFNTHWLGKWINTSVHHNQHHEHANSSFGIYLTVWDRLMGTMNPEYDRRFNQVTNPT